MQDRTEDNALKASVIIPCYNARGTIESCLGGVLAQNYPCYEVIVIDDDSNDGTVDVLKGIPGIKLICNDANRGPAYSRNKAIKAATGQIIVMFDSDCLVDDKNVISKHVLAHRDPSVHILGGGIQGIGRSVVARADNYSHWFLNIPHSAGRTGTHLVTNNMSVKRHVFDEIGCFDTGLKTGEDTDFCERALKAGYKLILKTDIIVKHHDREKLKDFIRCFYLVGIDRIPARRLKKHRYWYLLPFNFFSSLLYIPPLSALLTFQIICAWFRYDKRVVLYLPILFIGRLSMTLGIAHYYFFNSVLVRRAGSLGRKV